MQYLLSMANGGANTNTAHFSITIAPAHHLVSGHDQVVVGHPRSAEDCKVHSKASQLLSPETCLCGRLAAANSSSSTPRTSRYLSGSPSSCTSHSIHEGSGAVRNLCTNVLVPDLQDGHYTIFGEAVSGFDVIEKVNALSRGQPNNELLHSQRAQITDAGQLRMGSYRPPPEVLEQAKANA